MRCIYKNIEIREYKENDISDDIRWFNVENDWIKLDTPWEDMEYIVPSEYIIEMKEMLKQRKKGLKSRYEIDIDGKHIGFLTLYLLENISDEYAIGIEICESKFRNQGYGSKILKTFIEYLSNFNIYNLYLETHSKNIPMIKTAKKVGFDIIKIEKNKWYFNNITYDRLLMKLKNS